MRLNVFYIVSVCALLISCDNDDYPYSEVPSVVLNSFRTQFPNATDVEFKKLDGHYEVEFETNQDDAGAIIDSGGTVLEVRREVSWNDLPVEVRNNLDKEFGKKKIEDPEIITAGDQMFFQVQIKRFLTDKKVVLDRRGKPNPSLDYWD